jgi:hypothetical protein
LESGLVSPSGTEYCEKYEEFASKLAEGLIFDAKLISTIYVSNH